MKTNGARQGVLEDFSPSTSSEPRVAADFGLGSFGVGGAAMGWQTTSGRP